MRFSQLISGDPNPKEREEMAGPTEVLYSLSGVSKRYGSGDIAVNAIDGIDLEIGRGEFVVIVGPSGSGKSTLLQMLGALDRQTAGRIEFEGRDLQQLGDRELADLRSQTLGFVFQQFNLIPTLTAEENIEIAMAPRRLDSAVRSELARTVLDRVGLLDRSDHFPGQLSGGEQQRVAIARALVNQPDVILADEPTGNLDSKTGEAILSLLRELWVDTGLTVVLITHDNSIAERAPRVIRFADGRIQSDESRAGHPGSGLKVGIPGE
jgi:putative ABC transport system ATP-binding protein